DHDVTAFLSLCTEIPVEDVVHSVHRLRTATESQDARIRLGSIVAIGKDNLIIDRRVTDLLCLLEQFCLERWRCQHEDADGREKAHYVIRLHFVHLCLRRLYTISKLDESCISNRIFWARASSPALAGAGRTLTILDGV